MTTIDTLRLSREIIPVHYNLLVIPIFENWTFEGVVIIVVNVLDEVTEIRLNSLELQIEEAKFNEQIAVIKYDIQLEHAILSFDEPITKGEGTLTIEFIGILNDNMRGFYGSTYKTEAGDDVKIAITQFGPIEARRAFPCWDEPNFKATFEVTLIVPKGFVALSNMPEICRESISENEDKVRFEKSPPMSTFLLAFAIGEFDSIESGDENEFKVRVFTDKNKSHRGKFALDVCVKMMKFYENYFNIPYQLPKLDLIVVPDFIHGAMENWGLISFRETSLLIDDKESSVKSKRWVTTVIAHECAHMWFGNLVTIDWWNDIWLSEGFATWISCCAIDHCYPEYGVWCDFAEENYGRAMNIDSLQSSHPIQVHIQRLSDIISYFDAISYSKAACLINMLNDYISAEIFQKGLKLFLDRYQYKNAASDDIWDILYEVSGEPIADVVNVWLKKTGFPLIYMRSLKNDQGETVAVSLKQIRYFRNDIPDSGDYWYIPITLSPVRNPKKILTKVILKPSGEPQIFYLPRAEHDLVRINASTAGFYHVHYDDDTLAALRFAITNDILDSTDRLRLVLDLFALARAGIIPITTTLDFIRVYGAEKCFRVWHALLNNFRMVSSLIDELDTAIGFKVNKFIEEIIEPVFLLLGWEERENETDNDKLLRSIIITTLGRIGNKSVIEESLQRFSSHFRFKAVSLGPNIRSAVYSTALKNGYFSHLYVLLDSLKKTDSDEERIRILKALGSVPEYRLPYVIQFTMSQKVKKLDKLIVFMSSTTSAKKRLLIWDFVRIYWTQVSNQVLGFSFECFDGFARFERYCDLEKFFSAYSAQRPLKQLLENISTNIKILERDGDKLRNFFL